MKTLTIFDLLKFLFFLKVNNSTKVLEKV